MACVLLVDDDYGTTEMLSIGLRLEGHRVISVARAADALSASRTSTVDVALIDLRLLDIDGIELLKHLRVERPQMATVIITAFGTTRSAVEAIQLGACQYLEKPVDIDAVTDLVARLTASASPKTAAVHHAAARWAQAVVPLIHSQTDPKTLRDWARHVAASPGAIRNWCRAAKLKTKRSLNFARMLRVVINYQDGARAEDLLDIVDTRSLTAFLKLGSKTARPCSLPLGVEEFIRRQQWITDDRALEALREVLLQDTTCRNGCPPVTSRTSPLPESTSKREVRRAEPKE